MAVGALIDAAREAAEKTGDADVERAVFNGLYSPSIHLLACTSLELLLKAACFLRGADERRLREVEIRHNLPALLDEAETLGFVFNTPNLQVVTRYLGGPHSGHRFRYGGSPQVPMPELETTLAVLYGLSHDLHGLVEAD